MCAYDRELGNWWIRKANDPSHREAYRHIAGWLQRKLPRVPGAALDYACGAGHLLVDLRGAFPRAHLTGYDGAGWLLEDARRTLPKDRKLELVEKLLPDLTDRHAPFDLTVLCLPQLLPPDDPGIIRHHALRHPADARAAREIAKTLRRAGIWDMEDSLDGQADNALVERMVARHLRRLTRAGGHCARVEYSQTEYDGIHDDYLDYLRFIYGSATSVRGIRIQRLFHHIADTFTESDVISDVHDQIGDDGEGGGYVISLLRAV